MYVDIQQANNIISERNYKQLFAQAPAPIAIYKGRELLYVFVNEAYSKIFNGRDILGKTVREAFPELEGQPYFQILETVFDTGIPFYANETPALIDMNNDGLLTTRYYNLVYSAFTNDDGNIEGVMAFGHDVTDQVIARQKTADAEENVRLAIESADLGTFEINLLDDEMTVSPRFNLIWGFAQEVRRLEYISAIHPHDLSRRENALQEALLTGNLHYEVRVIWKDKSEHWVRVKGKVLYNAEKTAVRLLGVIQDITEQKQFAEQLKSKVEEGTRELREINERLESSNQELEQFAYIASHDLQEPLRKIQIFNKLLLEKSELPIEGRKYAEKVNESAQRMTGLIRDLLDYSRLTQAAIQFSKTDLNIILKNVLSDFELLIQQKKAVIQSEPLDTIEAVSFQMNQLIFNLIGNALKFSKRDIPPVISIASGKLSTDEKTRFQQLDPQKHYYKLVIKDNGIGFQQLYADKIFTIFQRINERSLYGGYGIGLALCRKIVENHNGVIFAESKPKEGAAFSVILPYEQE